MPEPFDLRDFSARNRRRSEHPHGFNHRLDSWSLGDWFTALTGEVGEAGNLIKKLNRLRDGIPGNHVGDTAELLRLQLEDELADVLCYLDLLAQAAGVDLARAVHSKFERVSARMGYIDGKED